MKENEFANVKLVDTAGTLRLDLNDRRVHMTREQALELFVELGAALHMRSGIPLVLEWDSQSDNRAEGEPAVMSASVTMSKRGLMDAAVAIASVAREVNQ